MTLRIFTYTLLTLLLACATGMGEETANSKYDHSLKADSISFEWTLGEADMNIRLSAKTKGWVAVGFNPSEKMKDANFILGYVKKGKVTVTDHYGTTAHQHKSDKKLGGQNNFSNTAGEEKGGITTIAFTIPLDSGDDTDRAINPDEKTTVLLAYGSGRDSFRSRHKFRTALSVDLRTGEFEVLK